MVWRGGPFDLWSGIYGDLTGASRSIAYLGPKTIASISVLSTFAIGKPLSPEGCSMTGVSGARPSVLLCELDDDPLGSADVAESVAVLVAHQLADELSAGRL